MGEILHLSGGWVSGISLALGLGLIFASLMLITQTMRIVIAHRAERALNRVLQRSMVFSIALGAAVTMAVQSSSITTSLMVPMCGSGILTLESAFPVLLGANIGTTITAFLASLATDVNGLEIALVHVMFNLVGVVAVAPFVRIRRIPLMLAENLAIRATHNKVWVLIFVGMVFVVIPLLGILIF
jgi:sodium-dependent phosphate cotransporter